MKKRKVKGETGNIIKVSGPLVVARGMEDANVYDVVKVADSKLIGEIIEMRDDRASIQVYEETGGIGPGEPVETTGEPLSVELGPGLVENMFDGIQRPLETYREKVGDFLIKGVEIPSLNREKKWKFVPEAKVGSKVFAGDVLGYVQETPVVKHLIMVPHGISGELTEIAGEEYTVVDKIASIKSAEIGRASCRERV